MSHLLVHQVVQKDLFLLYIQDRQLRLSLRTRLHLLSGLNLPFHHRRLSLLFGEFKLKYLWDFEGNNFQSN